MLFIAVAVCKSSCSFPFCSASEVAKWCSPIGIITAQFIEVAESHCSNNSCAAACVNALFANDVLVSPIKMDKNTIKECIIESPQLGRWQRLGSLHKISEQLF